MKLLKDFFAGHPRFATALHVLLAALPLTLALLFLLGLAGIFLAGKETFYDWLVFLSVAGLAAFFSTGVIWLLSLLLYRFTHAVRETWPDGLRMALIRLNIIGGFLTFAQVLMLIVLLVKR